MTMTETAGEPAVDDAQDQADFDAGVAMEEAQPKTAPAAAAPLAEDKAEPATPAAAVTPEPKPDYVQLTKEQYDRLDAAAKRSESHEQQMSRAFGTIGDMQKIVKTLQTQTPRGNAVKIPTDAFDAMKRDFPELAQHMQAAMEATLKGLEGTGGAAAHVDLPDFKQQVREAVVHQAIEDLEGEYPDWKQIVGAVAVGQQPDSNHPFRKWLAGKDVAYQARINGAKSAAVIARAISDFKEQTKSAPVAKPDPKAQARERLIQDAVRPKGDGGQPPMRGADDDFESGFRAG